MATQLCYLPSTTAPPPPRPPVPDQSLPAEADTAPPTPFLHLLIAYESGQLALFRFTPTRTFDLVPAPSSSSASPAPAQPHPPLHLPRQGVRVEESEGWELVWVEKGHRDASACSSRLPLPRSDTRSLSLSRRSHEPRHHDRSTFRLHRWRRPPHGRLPPRRRRASPPFPPSSYRTRRLTFPMLHRTTQNPPYHARTPS